MSDVPRKKKRLHGREAAMAAPTPGADLSGLRGVTKGGVVELGLAILGCEPDVGRVVPLPRGSRLVVGRSPDCGVRLAARTVGRTHCEVWHDGGGVWVRDLSSASGTRLNDLHISGEQLLRPCDSLGVGAALVRLAFLGPAEPAWLAWGDGAVPRLARAMRAEGWAGKGGLLHDALLDAGCNDEDVLGHCLAGCPAGVRAFAEEVLAEVRWRPDPVFMLDVGECGGRPWLVELSGFICSWLYACDVEAVVAAAGTLAERAREADARAGE